MWKNQSKFKRGKMPTFQGHFIEFKTMCLDYDQQKRLLIEAKHHKYLLIHILILKRELRKLYKKFNQKWIDYAWKNDLRKDLFKLKANV